MKGDNLPNEHHVVRYVNHRNRKSDGSPTGAAFSLRKGRPDETGLSVNWLEYFDSDTKDQQLDEVRRLLRLQKKKSACFAELNVGITKQRVHNELDDLRFIHMPLCATNEHEADLSHSEIINLPSANSPEAELIGDMIAECVQAIHPAVIG